MKKIFLIMKILLLFSLSGCVSTGESVLNEKISGEDLMAKYGTKLTPLQVFEEIAIVFDEYGMGDLYRSTLDKPNNLPVFVLDRPLELDESGYVVDENNIVGHVEVPPTFREYILKGGLGIPVYKESPVLGMAGASAKVDAVFKDGVIVRKDPFQNVSLYILKFNSDVYDKISVASVLYQAAEIVKYSYYKNFLAELNKLFQGSEGKDKIYNELKNFREENRGKYKTEDELEMAFYNDKIVQGSYLKIITKGNEQVIARIKLSKEFVEVLNKGCAIQTGDIAKMFMIMTVEIAEVTALYAQGVAQAMANNSIGAQESYRLAGEKLGQYLAKYLPKGGPQLKRKEIEAINKYNKICHENYKKRQENNREMWAESVQLISKIDGYYTIKASSEITDPAVRTTETVNTEAKTSPEEHSEVQEDTTQKEEIAITKDPETNYDNSKNTAPMHSSLSKTQIGGIVTFSLGSTIALTGAALFIVDYTYILNKQKTAETYDSYLMYNSMNKGFFYSGIALMSTGGVLLTISIPLMVVKKERISFNIDAGPEVGVYLKYEL